jgi:DNA polymerase-3 subunit alpha
MSAGYVHLHLHTEYSLVDSVVRIADLLPKVAEAAMPAVAVTDQGNMFAMVKFYRAAIAAGVKPIIGAEMLVDGGAGQPHRCVLLCQNRTGYRNLTKLITRTYVHGQQRAGAVLDKAWLHGATDGLIALSGGRVGEVGHALLSGGFERAQQSLREWLSLFPQRFYLELQRTGREGEDDYLEAAVQLAGQTDCPVVATNDVRFLTSDDFEAHEARVCIQEGRTLGDPHRARLYSEQQFLRSAESMQQLFEDVPEAIENSVAIAQRCNLRLQMDDSYLPDFPVPQGDTTEAYFRRQAEQGLQERLERPHGAAPDDYAARLQRELDVICQMGFPGYFLIVADFIRWARENGIPVGPGRGSGAGSLVAYALKITDLDPLEFELLFERFLNPERVSLPDFDVDFCMEGRDRVIDYVAEKYGREKVSQIITYGSMAARAVVRDVGRVLGHPYGFVDRIAKLIPFELGMTLEKALQESEELAELSRSDDDVRSLLDLAQRLEGLARNAGKHAGGVVIAPSELTDFAPLYCEPGGDNVVTQFDKDDIEAIGLVKFDFLGLRTLTVIDLAVRIVNQERAAAGEVPIDIADLPKEDAATYGLLQSCATTAVFQLESRGMKDLIKRLQPDCFEDVVALVALFRPGPLQSGMVDDFIDRKHGRAGVAYPHPALEPILKPTYGVILYQEQVMQIAQELAGYTLGGADLLRRAMGKKKPEEMAKQRDVFVAGALHRDIDERIARPIFDLMEKFAGYGFNKSHSAAYALLAYQTAWLKTHYPAAFMASVLTADLDNTDKIVTLIDECENLGLEVLGPDVNESDYAFTVVNRSSIRYGLGAIKGVGRGAIDVIVTERAQHGAFPDLARLCRRVDAQRVNRRVLEALIRAGALDAVDSNRAQLLAGLPELMRAAEQQHRAAAVGQDDLFGAGMAEPLITPRLPEVRAWDEPTRLLAEKESLGLYLTGHPINQYRAELDRLTDGRIGAQCERVEPGQGRRYGNGKQSLLAGLVVNVRTRNTQSGGRIAFVTIDDRSARIDVMVTPELLQSAGAVIVRDQILVVEGELSTDDFNGGFRARAKALYDLDQARRKFARALRLQLSADRADAEFMPKLRETLTPYRDGDCALRVEYRRADAVAQLNLGDAWRVRPSEALLEQLRELCGEEQVELLYQRSAGAAG